MADLTKNILFSGLNARQIDRIIKRCGGWEKQLKDGEAAVRQGDILHYMGIVLSGTAVGKKYTADGEEIIVSRMGENRIFADVLSGAAGFASPVSVFAVGQCRVLFLDYNRLLSCTLPQGPAVLKNMIQNISLKYFAQNRRMDILMMKSLREKITAYLLWQKQMSGTDEFDIDLDRRLLADFLAVERSALSRELSRMKKDGLIRYKKNHFKLFF